MKSNRLTASFAAIDAGNREADLTALRRGIGRLVVLLRLWRRRHGDRRELARLDDRTLRDIGLTRGTAEFLINKPFWRE